MADNKINVGGRLHSIATGNVLAGANEILDDVKGKKQSEINAETDTALEDRYSKSEVDGFIQEHQDKIDDINDTLDNTYKKNETYNKTELNNLITTPNQQYISVTATDQTTAVTDVLPAIGEADTVYRVGNWDGSQFDASVYSEYTWNGSQYVHLSTKTQIGEVFNISTYHATGGELAKYVDLTAALDSNNGGGVPQSLQKGGMSVKFVRTSDNKYIQFRYMLQYENTTSGNNAFKNPDNWQGVDDELTAGSHNLAESGVVFEENIKLSQKVDGGETTFNYEISAGNVAQGVIKYPSETGTYIVKCYSTSALTLSFRETAEGTSYYAHTVQPNETYEFEIEGTFNWLRYYNVASGSFSISRKENNKSEIIKIKQDIAEINNTDSPSEDSNKFVKSGDIYNYTKKVVNDRVENAIILEKNGIVSGVDTVNAARFRTYGYIKAPFSITLVSGYVIVQQFKYKIVKGSIVYDSLVQVNADTLTVDNEDEYLYKLSFKRTDNANITDSDLTSAVSAFNAYNYIDAYVRSKANNINMLDGIAETYTDIPFIPISGGYYNASGEIVLEQDLTRFAIPLNSGIKKLRFLVTASSKAKFGFVVNGTFTALSHGIGERIGTSYTYKVTIDVPSGATELRISTADVLLILPQKVEAIETVSDLFADVKLQLSSFIVEDNIETGNYGYLLENGTLNSNATYKHSSVDLTKAVYKKLCITYAYVGSTVATYGFIVDGVWQGVRIDIPSPYTEIRTAVIDVPDGATEFRCSWNMNVLSTAQLVVYAQGLKAIEDLRKDIKDLEEREVVIHNKLQIDPTFDLDCVPEMTGTTETLVLSTTLETFYGWYDALASAYPNYITKVDCDAHAQSELGITKPSYLDGLPIYMYKLKPAIGLPYSTGTTEYITKRPKVLLTSMHPQERFGDFALYKFVKMLCENWSDDMNIGVLRSFVDFYILPFAWPWNFVNNSRVNYNGVNANRQFPTIGWHVEGEPGNDNYSGQEPLSEYEAKVVALYVREIQPDVVIDIHTSDQDESGLMGMVECRSDNDLIMNLVGAICRTTSNAAIADNPNYPQNDPDHTIYRMYPSLNGGHVGIFFVYCYEQGIKYSILTEESARSKWNNGVFDINGPVIEKYTNGLLRQQVQYLFNCVLRMVKSFVDNN